MDAAVTARELRARGHEPQILPAEEIVTFMTPPPLGPFAGVLVTSAHAVPALNEAFSGTQPKFFAVGGRTAAALRASGFVDVSAGSAGAEELVAPAAHLSAAAGLPLLYAAGRVRTDALEKSLAQRAVTLRLWEVYDVRLRDLRREEIADATGGEAPDAVLLLSRGQVAAYLRLAERLPGGRAATPRLLCLSARIVECRLCCRFGSRLHRIVNGRWTGIAHRRC